MMFEVITLIALSAIFSVAIFNITYLSPFKCKPVNIESAAFYRLMKGVKLSLLFTLSFSPFLYIFYSNDFLFFSSLIALPSFLVGYSLPPKIYIPYVNELTVSTELFSKTVNIHLANYDDPFTRSSYKRLNEVLFHLNERGYESIKMTSPLFSKYNDVRDFRTLEAVLKKQGYIMFWSEVKPYEHLLTRISFAIVRAVSNSKSLKNVGNKWIHIKINKSFVIK